MSIVFILAVLPWLLPAFSLLALTLASLRRPEAALTDRNDSAPAARIAALVPAHNESTHLLPTIACLRSQLGPDDRLLVVADNCDDDTADSLSARILEAEHRIYPEAVRRLLTARYRIEGRRFVLEDQP